MALELGARGLFMVEDVEGARTCWEAAEAGNEAFEVDIAEDAL